MILLLLKLYSVVAIHLICPYLLFILTTMQCSPTQLHGALYFPPSTLFSIFLSIPSIPPKIRSSLFIHKEINFIFLKIVFDLKLLIGYFGMSRMNFLKFTEVRDS